jgi:hypothetical protein
MPGARGEVAEQMWIVEQLVWAVSFVEEIQYPLKWMDEKINRE